MRTGFVCLALLIGCAAVDDEDSIDDSFLVDGKADGAIAEGSPTAVAVLSIANSASESKLHDDVGLSTRAAHNIANHTKFDTLAELDAVPYVGKTVFDHLVAYAKETGLLADLPKGKLLDCNISFGVDQQVTVISDGSSLTLRELTDSGSLKDRALDVAEWNREKLNLRGDGFGSKTTLTKSNGDWIAHEIGPGIEETAIADCWVDKSH